MRALPVRRIATTVLCASLLIGTAGPVIAAESDTPHDSAQEAARAPVADAEKLLAQVKTLGDAGGVLTPVTNLLTAVLKADKGQLPADDATKLAAPVKDAITKAAAEPSKAPELPETPAVPEAQTLPQPLALPKAADDAASADPKADALKALQTAVDALVKAATGGDAKAVSGAAPTVVTDLVNLVAATLVGGGLPAPDLAGLPALPKAPEKPAAQAPALS
ncbi:hypothetical protein ACWGII_19670 [Streptomyces sp. NPDC054855]